MREVGVLEAKNKFGQLLDLVEQGEEVTITRHGKAVARLGRQKRTMPSRREQALAAGERIRQRAEACELRFDWTEWKAYRDEGHP